MKRLSEEEYKSLNLKGKGRSSELFNAITNLREGEALLIERKDWNRKAGPSTLVRYIEKNHQMRFSCASLSEGEGWVVRRLPDGTPGPAPKAAKKPDKEKAEDNEEIQQLLLLKSEVTIFYLGRISAMKIERIEETIKAVQAHFIDADRSLIKRLLLEIVELLGKQRHIVIENEKTYLPLKRN